MKKSMLFCAAGLLVLMAACHKNDDDALTGAGKGGNAVLRIKSQHHTPPTIDSIEVYLKYNAKNLPTTFDDSIYAVKTATDTVAIFAGLKNGTYYIYGYGWDRRIRDTVLGGVPYTITSQDTINLTLPVTEGD